MFKVVLSSKMNELPKAGANHPTNEEENTCKNEEDTNTIQAGLLVRTRRTRRVYPKKPRIKKTQEPLTPDQLCNAQQKKRNQRKAADVRRKEKRAVFEESLTVHQLCKTQQIQKD